MTIHQPFLPTPDVEFARSVDHIGEFALRRIEIPGDIALLHDWVTRDYASFWGMQNKCLAELEAFYREMDASPHAEGYLGFFEGHPAFLMESYDPRHDRIADHYPVAVGDRGMHFLVAPSERPIHGFTLEVLRTILTFLFRDWETARIVVEPDERNSRIHVLNRRVGFRYEGKIGFPDKTADLAFCSRADFFQTLTQAA